MNVAIRDRLARCPLCSKLPDACIEDLVRRVETREFGAGEMVFRAGDAAENLFVLLTGSVALSVGEDGSTIARFVDAGQTFGESAMCGDHVFPVSAEAVETAVIAILPAAGIRDLLGERQDVALRILGTLSQQLRELIGQIADLKTKSSAQRLARYLLGLAGTDRSNSVVRLPQRKRRLAHELGMQPETLSRALSQLQALGVRPAPDTGALVLTDIDALRSYCQVDEEEAACDPALDASDDVSHLSDRVERRLAVRRAVPAPKSQVLTDRDEFGLVREIPLFSGLPEDIVEAVIEGASTVQLAKQQLLFSAGDRAESFFVVLSGAVKLFVLEDDGAECLIDIVDRGSSFAEAAVIAMRGYPVNAEALDPSRLLCISRRHLAGMLERHPSMGPCMVGSLVRWQLRLSQELWQLRARTPAQRLAWLLLSLTDQRTGSATVRLHYPKFVVAAKIGIRPESMSRALARLCDMGVHAQSDQITIDDVEGLRQFAGMPSKPAAQGLDSAHGAERCTQPGAGHLQRSPSRPKPNPADVMRFHADTNVAEAIAADPSLIDRLSALCPMLERLRKPEERATFGPAFSLSDLAAEAGLRLSDLLLAANAQSPGACAAEIDAAPEEDAPAWMTGFRESDAAHIDVRALISADEEPFTRVMATAAGVSKGGGLVLDAPFNPLPLRGVLGRKGFATYGRRLSESFWRVYGLRTADDPDVAPPVETDLGAKVWSAEDGVHIDVSDLEAPAPLVAILSLVDSSDHRGRIVVHHRREPHYLYPELLERGWSWSRMEGKPGDVRLLLTRSADGGSER